VNNNNAKNDPVNRLWNFFSSMRCGILLILILSGILALATIWAPSSGDSNIYRTPWFLLLVGLLCMNLIICTINRLHILINSISPKPSLIIKKDFDKLPLNYRSFFTTDRVTMEQYLCRLFRSRRFKVGQVTEGDSSYFYFYRGNFGSWCSLLLHLSLVIIVAGVLWGGMTGFETKVTIPEGYTSDLSGAEQLDPAFKIRLEDFDTLYDEEGNIVNWVSRISILSDEGDVLAQGESKVNHPLNYRGVNLYQHSYGQALKLNFIKDGQDDPQSIVLSQDRFYHHLEQLEGMGLWVGVYQDGKLPFSFSDGTKEVAEGYLRQGERVKIPGDNNRYLELSGTIPFSVLQVKKDPGVPVVFTGLALMAISFFGTVFTGQRRCWARIKCSREGSGEVIIGGLKNRRGVQDMEEEFSRLTGKLEKFLQAGGEDGKTCT